MSNQEKYKEDLLRQYLNPEMIEKVPEGFTSKVMTRIQLETAPSLVAEKSGKRSLIPVISAVVTILLSAVAFLIPVSDSDPLALPVLKLLRNISLSLPNVNLASFFKLNFSSVMMYVFIGILVLTFFDRALYVIFHREK